jgi:hypothetical protein
MPPISVQARALNVTWPLVIQKNPITTKDTKVHEGKHPQALYGLKPALSIPRWASGFSMNTFQM